MKLSYWMRIAIGALLGSVALASLWLTLGMAWLTAVVASLLAIVGFLGSYFVVSADRPAEGYEQVLFDKPNTIVTLVLLVAFAGAGVGTGLLGGSSGASPSSAEYVQTLRTDYLLAASGWSKDAEKNETLTTLATLREESDRIAADLGALPEGDARAELETANDALAFAIDALKVCAEKDERSCLDARLNAADAESALSRYAALAG